MKKLIALMFAVLLSVTTTLTPAAAVTDYGNPAIARLWVNVQDGFAFICTVSYVFPYIDDRTSWLLTASHCTEGDLVRRSVDVHNLAQVVWRMTLNGTPRYTERCADVALGTAPDVRSPSDKKHLWLAKVAPARGNVYIHGFPAGVENVVVGGLLPAEISKGFGGCRLVAVPREVIKGGSSGSPVMDHNGYVVGVLWGLLNRETLDRYYPELAQLLNDRYELVIMTPIEVVHELMQLLKVRT